MLCLHVLFFSTTAGFVDGKQRGLPGQAAPVSVELQHHHEMEAKARLHLHPSIPAMGDD